MRTPLWFPLALLATALLVSALTGLTAHAQVAAPMLNTVGPQTFRPVNPGTVPWSGPSRVGGGTLDEEGTAEVGGVATALVEGDGHFLQVRLVGTTFAFAAESLDIELQDVSTPGQSFDVKFTQAQLGAQFGEWLGVGVGRQAGESPGDFGIERTVLPSAGVSLRLGGAVYFGAAGGTETVEIDNLVTPAVETDRTALILGAAYHWRDDDRGLHLEWYHDERDPAVFASGDRLLEASTDGYTAEAVFLNVLLAYEAASIDLTDTVGGIVTTKDFDRTRVSVGWVQGQGLNLVASLFTEEQVVGTVTRTFEVTSIGATWNF